MDSVDFVTLVIIVGSVIAELPVENIVEVDSVGITDDIIEGIDTFNDGMTFDALLVELTDNVVIFNDVVFIGSAVVEDVVVFMRGILCVVGIVVSTSVDVILNKLALEEVIGFREG